jgi:hypothetical protein
VIDWKYHRNHSSTYNLGLSLPAIALKHFTSLLSTQLFQSEGQIKKNGQRSYIQILGRDKSYFVKNHSDSTKKFSETDIINMLEFLIDNTFVIFRTCFSTDSRHTYGCKLCSSSRRLVPLFLWGRLHTRVSQEKRKETSPIL